MRILLKGKYYLDQDRMILIASKKDKENKSVSNVYITVINPSHNLFKTNMESERANVKFELSHADFELKSEGNVPLELKASAFSESDMKKFCDIIDNWADDVKLDMLCKYSDIYNLL